MQTATILRSNRRWLPPFTILEALSYKIKVDEALDIV